MSLARFRSVADMPWAIQTDLRGWAGIRKALELGATTRWLSGGDLPRPGLHRRKITMVPATAGPLASEIATQDPTQTTR